MPDPGPRRLPLDLSGLGAPAALFRLPGAVRRDPLVDRWLNDDAFELRALARHWFERLRACGADVLERMHDGCPVACLADVPFAYVNAFKRHVSVGFFHGALLDDPCGLLAGDGKRMRHVKCYAQDAPDDPPLVRLIEAAYADVRVRLRAPP